MGNGALRRCHGEMAICAMLSLVAAVPPLFAGPGREGQPESVAGPPAGPLRPDTATTHAASTNQSVSIEESTAKEAGQGRPTQDWPQHGAARTDPTLPGDPLPSGDDASLPNAFVSRRTSETAFARRSEPHRGAWFRTGLGALALVLLLIGGLAWAVKRWLPATRRMENGVLRVAGQASLTPKHSVALLQVGQRFVVVGLAGDSIGPLCEINDPQEVAYLAARTNAAAHRQSDAEFEAVLRREAANYQVEDGGSAEAPRQAPFDRSAPGPAGLRDLLGRLRAIHG